MRDNSPRGDERGEPEPHPVPGCPRFCRTTLPWCIRIVVPLRHSLERCDRHDLLQESHRARPPTDAENAVPCLPCLFRPPQQNSGSHHRPTVYRPSCLTPPRMAMCAPPGCCRNKAALRSRAPGPVCAFLAIVPQSDDGCSRCERRIGCEVRSTGGGITQGRAREQPSIRLRDNCKKRTNRPRRSRAERCLVTIANPAERTLSFGGRVKHDGRYTFGR